MILYADTSALVKLLLDEEGSSGIRDQTAGADVIVSVAIGYVELRAAIASALRDGRVPPPERVQMMVHLEQLWDGVSEIALERTVLRLAGDLSEQMGLRGYDAVHLAGLSQLPVSDDVVFACWDAALRVAAERLGYQLFPA